MRHLLVTLLLFLLMPAVAQDAGELIEQGRPREALERIPPGDEGELLRAKAHTELGQRVIAESLLERLWARKEHLSPEIRRQLMLEQAEAVLNRHQVELAERLLRDALREASTPDDRLEVLDHLIHVCLWKRDEAEADRLAEQAALLVPEVTSPSRVAGHQLMLAHLADRHGRRSEAIALYTGCRALYVALGQPVQAAGCTLYISYAGEAQGRLEDSYRQAIRGLQELRQAGHLQEAEHAISQLVSLGFQLPRTDEVASLLVGVIDELPRGLTRDRARLKLAELWLRNHQEPLAREMLEAMLAEEDLIAESKGPVMAELALVYRTEKRYDEALSWIEKALRDAPLNPPSLDYWSQWGYSRPSLLAARGRVQQTQRRYPEALQSFRLAAEASVEPERLVQKVVYQGEALSTALKSYDIETAREFLNQGLLTIERTPFQDEASPALIRLLMGLTSFGADTGERLTQPPRWLGGQNPLATVILREAFSAQADLQRQLSLHDDWIEDLRRRGDTAFLVRMLFWKQQILQARGRAPEARQVALEAIALADQHGIPDVRRLASLSLAGLEYREGHLQTAGELLGELVEIGKSLEASDHRSALLVHAHFLRENGSPEKSLSLYQQAAELDPRRAAPAHYGKAQALLALSRFEEAEDELGRVEETLGEPAESEAAALKSLRGRLYGRTDRHHQAVGLLCEALPAQKDEPALAAMTASDLARSLRGLGSTREAYQTSRRELDTLLSLPGVDHRDLKELFSLVVELALEVGEQEQALHYLELSRSAELVGSINLGDLSSADPETESLLRLLEELKVRLTALQGQQTEDEVQTETLQRVLTSTRAEFFAKLDQLKKTQPDFEALVQLSGADLSVLQKTLAADEVLLEYYPAEDRLYIFAVTSAGFELREVALSRQELSTALKPFVAQVRDPDSDLAALRRRARELGELLVPEDLVRNRRRARLVPSGLLWEVPFEALSDAEGRTLDDRLEVSYLTSADLLRTLQGRGDSHHKRALLIGAPDGEDLPGARRELEGLSSLLSGSVQLMGAQASGDALRRLGPVCDVIHMATHSGLGRSLGEGYLELSDGDFTLADIYGLALRPGSLVVLSSCQSALGKERPGREVTSLASAFNIAGASTVIASHWEVDDQETARLFRSFYKHLLNGDKRGEALRSARLELARTAPHPYYWAAFSLFGRPD